jgi:hypothetical protein
MNDNSDKSKSDLAGLVVESDVPQDKNNFSAELENTLKLTEQAVLSQRNNPAETKSWATARGIIEKFEPVPWFIWRISNFVLGTPGKIQSVNEGFVLGLRRLLFATASDPILGGGEKVNDVKKALKILGPDVIAAVAVIHAICRRLLTKEFERIWRPILEDAILRSQIGALIGAADPAFGQGRGMLAGFSSRAGLAILLSSGELEQAREALELLATGKEISEVGLKIYECNPLQVSAMMLSASGCGRDAAFGTVSYAYKDSAAKVENQEQLKWLSAFTLTESIRVGKVQEVDEKLWQTLGLIDQTSRDEILEHSKKAIRRGHEWGWLL